MIFEGLTKIGLRPAYPAVWGSGRSSSSTTRRPFSTGTTSSTAGRWRKTLPAPPLSGSSRPTPALLRSPASPGVGHLEVAKHRGRQAQEGPWSSPVKPFGCMPSTQSDGVQTKVISDYPDSIFIPIETSGDAEVNVRSRIQMKLFEARQKARRSSIAFSRTRGSRGRRQPPTRQPIRTGSAPWSPARTRTARERRPHSPRRTPKAIRRERSVRHAFRRVQDKAHEGDYHQGKDRPRREEAAGLAERIVRNRTPWPGKRNPDLHA